MALESTTSVMADGGGSAGAEAIAFGEVQKAQLSANSTLSSNAENATSTLGSEVEDIDNVFRMTWENFMSQGVNGNTGLNKDKIANMKDAVASYVSSVNGALDKFTAVNANKAFGPEIGGKVYTFVQSIKDVCQAIVSNMNGFKDDLDGVLRSYTTKEAGTSATVANSASAIASAASSWVYSGDSESQ